MSDATGILKKVSYDSTTLVLPFDIEVNFFPGGYINTESLQNVGSQTPKVEYRGGFLKAITTRLSEDGSLKKLFDLLVKTTKEDVPLIFEFANGDKWSASVFGVVDPDSFFSNTEAKGTFDVYPRAGVFTAVK